MRVRSFRKLWVGDRPALQSVFAPWRRIDSTGSGVEPVRKLGGITIYLAVTPAREGELGQRSCRCLGLSDLIKSPTSGRSTVGLSHLIVTSSSTSASAQWRSCSSVSRLLDPMKALRRRPYAVVECMSNSVAAQSEAAGVQAFANSMLQSEPCPYECRPSRVPSPTFYCTVVWCTKRRFAPFCCNGSQSVGAACPVTDNKRVKDRGRGFSKY